VSAGPSPQLPVDVRQEAERLSATIVAEDAPVRIMGGLAVWLRCDTARRPPFEREYRDIDIVAPGRARKQVSAFLEAAGYVPDRLFNALHGAQRLVYRWPSEAWSLDVIFDELNMSHRIDLRGRLGLPGATLDLADLLMTKLQVWQVNEKDLGDAACILADHALVASEATPDGLDLVRIRALTGTDWGLCHTTERNLGRVREEWTRRAALGTRFDVANQVDALLGEIARAPKSMAWKARARVGERVRWYETPEELRT
jgi:hypothetical protein